MSSDLRELRVVVMRCRVCDCGRVSRNSSIRRQQAEKPRPLRRGMLLAETVAVSEV